MKCIEAKGKIETSEQIFSLQIDHQITEESDSDESSEEASSFADDTPKKFKEPNEESKEPIFQIQVDGKKVQTEK